jgi:hypothetical protein
MDKLIPQYERLCKQTIEATYGLYLMPNSGRKKSDFMALVREAMQDAED